MHEFLKPSLRMVTMQSPERVLGLLFNQQGVAYRAVWLVNYDDVPYKIVAKARDTALCEELTMQEWTDLTRFW